MYLIFTALLPARTRRSWTWLTLVVGQKDQRLLEGAPYSNLLANSANTAVNPTLLFCTTVPTDPWRPGIGRHGCHVTSYDVKLVRNSTQAARCIDPVTLGSSRVDPTSQRHVVRTDAYVMERGGTRYIRATFS